jgi:hypothetical protein
MRRILGGVLIVVVLATACSDDSGGDAAPITTSSTTTSTTSTSTISTTVVPRTTEAPTTAVAELTDEEQIIAVVERFYEVIVEANNPPILDNPIWDEVATPELADGLRDRAPGNLEDREGLRHPDPAPPAVVSHSFLLLEADLAVLDVCREDDAILYDLDTGEILNDEVLFFWKQMFLVPTPEGWRVTDTNTIEEFAEVEPCVDSY